MPAETPWLGYQNRGGFYLFYERLDFAQRAEAEELGEVEPEPVRAVLFDHCAEAVLYQAQSHRRLRAEVVAAAAEIHEPAVGGGLEIIAFVYEGKVVRNSVVVVHDVEVRAVFGGELLHGLELDAVYAELAQVAVGRFQPFCEPRKSQPFVG